MRKTAIFILAATTIFIALEGIADRIGVLAKAYDNGRPLREVVSDLQAKAREIVEPAQIEFTRKNVTTVANEAAAGAIEASARASQETSPSRFRLTVNAISTAGEELSDARIRVMNIVPVYQDGIALAPGSYEIKVDAEGYRTRTVYFDADKDLIGESFELEVKMDTVGAKNCLDRMESYTTLPDVRNDVGSLEEIRNGEARDIMRSAVIEDRLLFRDTAVNDLINSYAQRAERVGLMRVVDQSHRQGYARFTVIQPTGLSLEEIQKRVTREIDDKRFILFNVIFERQGDDTLMVMRSLFPPGDLIRGSYDKEYMCNKVSDI
jgi:hypothetical protein